VVKTLVAQFGEGNVPKACADGSVYYVFLRGEHTERHRLLTRRLLKDDGDKCDFVVFAFTSEVCGFQAPLLLTRFTRLASNHPDRALITRICPLEEVEDLLSFEDDIPEEVSIEETCGDDTPATTATGEAVEEPRIKRARFQQTRAALRHLRVCVSHFFSPRGNGVTKSKERTTLTPLEVAPAC